MTHSGKSAPDVPGSCTAVPNEGPMVTHSCRIRQPSGRHSHSPPHSPQPATHQTGKRHLHRRQTVTHSYRPGRPALHGLHLRVHHMSRRIDRRDFETTQGLIDRLRRENDGLWRENDGLWRWVCRLHIDNTQLQSERDQTWTDRLLRWRDHSE